MSEPGDFTAKAEQLIAEAAALPSAEQVRALADRAVAHGGTESMSADEIRALACRAVDAADELAVQLRRLVELLPLSEPPPGGDL